MMTQSNTLLSIKIDPRYWGKDKRGWKSRKIHTAGRQEGAALTKCSKHFFFFSLKVEKQLLHHLFIRRRSNVAVAAVDSSKNCFHPACLILLAQHVGVRSTIYQVITGAHVSCWLNSTNTTILHTTTHTHTYMMDIALHAKCTYS